MRHLVELVAGAIVLALINSDTAIAGELVLVDALGHSIACWRSVAPLIEIDPTVTDVKALVERRLAADGLCSAVAARGEPGYG